MATRDSARKEGATPIHIQAQFLRDQPAFTPEGPMSGFAIAPEPVIPVPGAASGRKGTWCDDDLARAIDAAKEASLTSYRVEIAPDGTISIVVGYPAGGEGEPFDTDL